MSNLAYAQYTASGTGTNPGSACDNARANCENRSNSNKQCFGGLGTATGRGDNYECKVPCTCSGNLATNNKNNIEYLGKPGIQELSSNLITDFLELDYMSNENYFTILKVFDINGKIVSTQVNELIKGANLIQLGLPKLSSGIYLISCEDSYQISNFKFAVTQ